MNACRGGLKKCVNVQVFGLSVYVCVCVPVPVHAPLHINPICKYQSTQKNVFALMIVSRQERFVSQQPLW